MRMYAWFFVVLTCLLIGSSLIGYKVMALQDAAAASQGLSEPQETVEVVSVQQTHWRPQVELVGEVIAPQNISLRNEVAGRIAQVGFEPGARVSKGQLLLQLDISEEQAQLKAAQAQAELAALELQRLAALVKRNATSQDRYDMAKAEMLVTTARQQALRAIINKKTLIAPFDAYAGLHQLNVGQVLAENTEITRLVGIDASVWVDFDLPQQHAQLTQGTEVSVLGAGMHEPFIGQIIGSNAQVSQASRTLRMRARLAQAADVFKPGSLVKVVVPVGETKLVGLLPAIAIRRDEVGPYVYALQPDENAQTDADSQKKLRARRQPVLLGPEREQQVIIMSPLAPSTLIASKGSYKLREGVLVSVAAGS